MRAILAIALTAISSQAAEKKYHQPPAEPATIPHQYRHKTNSIPAAGPDEPRRPELSSAAAKNYLETGATLWSKQQNCFSCHTHGVYAAVRPALTPIWGPPPSGSREFLVEKAAELQHQSDISGTEPTKLAYLTRALVNWDAQFSKSTSPESNQALRFLFNNLQSESGHIDARNNWPPLNATAYHGTIVTAMAIADAPNWRASLNQKSDKTLLKKIDKLESYLRKTPPLNDHERLLLLWASTRIPSLLTQSARDKTLEMITRQQRPDGGWSIRTFATTETWGSPRRAAELATEPNHDNPESDGYMTGLTLLVLADAGIPPTDPRIIRGIKWLKSHQRESGRWWTKSLNVDSRFHFITYSGTAYAALALARHDALGSVD
ncbi:MAG: hypothetical protein AAF591_06120 [Verrucomicrobiota bacterium]